MKCPYCSFEDTKVVDKRDSDDLGVTRRRRECLGCKKRFTTYERVESVDLIVVKKDGRREQFDRSKLLRGIVKACEKRPISHDRIEKFIDKIEAELRKRKGTEVQSSVIGNLVINRLKRFDKVAYIRFASVYREFTDLNSFKKELQTLLNNKRGSK